MANIPINIITSVPWNGIVYTLTGGGGGTTATAPAEPTPADPPKKKDTDGCVCRKCGEFSPYAEASEDKEFTCYGCRVTW